MLAMLLGAGLPALACEERSISENIYMAPACVPREPQRIVVLDGTFSLGMALELGAPVVGAPMTGFSDADLLGRAVARGVTDLGTLNEPSLERIIALKPDLIIGSSFMAASHLEMLKRIAPTALIDVTDWKAYFSTVAHIVGREDAMKDMFAAYDRRIAEIRRTAPNLTVSVVRITSWDFQVYLDGPNAYAPFAILSEAGIKRTPYETANDETAMKRPDWEDLGNLTGDVLLYIVGGTNDSDRNGRHEEVVNNPLWKMLPAVQAGRVHRVASANWIEFNGLASANRVLDDIERYIIAAP
jgi:iron complex transport system substrate-binding protein